MLDKSKDFGHIFGDSPAKYYQGGKYFDARGYEINYDTGAVVETETAQDVVPDPGPDVTPDTEGLPDAVVEPQTEAPSLTFTGDEPEEKLDLGSLPWQKIKKMVEDAGGQYHNKQQAIAYLEGL